MKKKATRGRRPGTSATRPAILWAALHHFADHGFRRASIRAIAADADVDPALVHHYFGTKKNLYDAVTARDIDASEAIVSALAATRPGEELVATFLKAWDGGDEAGLPFAALMRSAADGSSANELTLLIASTVVAPAFAAADRTAPLPKLRAHLVAGHLYGLAWLRYVVRSEPIASASRAMLAKTYGPSVDALLLGETRPGTRPR